MRQTLEQRRAQNAWNCAERCNKEYVNLAKGLPALIMNSGLMQVMAFLHQKGDTHEEVSKQMRGWLQKRFPNVIGNNGFESFMESLLNAQPRDYQAITTEAFAWLKWLRQMAAARQRGN